MPPHPTRRRVASALAIMACLLSAASHAASLPLPGPATWKYLAFDSATHTLYVTQGTQLTAIDTTAMRIRGHLTGLTSAHGVAILPGGNGYVTDSKAAAVIAFDPATLRAMTTIPAGADANSLAYDPASRHVFAGNDDAGTVTIIDPATNRATGTIQLPGEEGIAAMAADGAGHLFIAHPATADIVRLATTTAPHIDATWKLRDCPKPEGLALDTAAHRLFVSCTGGTLLALDARDGRQLAATPIGPGNLMLVLDQGRHRLYVPTADATISVFKLSAAGDVIARSALPFAPGARGAALDPTTGRLYAVTASPASGTTAARFKPGTATLLAIDAPAIQNR